MNICFRKQIITLILCLITISLFPQDVPHPVKNTGVYEFLDELANSQITTINSAIKPYSRLFIANCLKEAEEKKDILSIRQQKELEFYMMDFGKETMEGFNGALLLRHHLHYPD